MERKIHIGLLTVLLLLGISAGASTPQALIYRAYSEGDMALWKRVVDRMDARPEKSSRFMLELVNYQYGYIAWAIGNERTDEARNYIQRADKYLDTLEGRGYRLADVYAYRAALLGFQISITPHRTPMLGPRSMRYARRAVEADPNAYMGHVQLGHIAYFMPAIMGGSKEQAIQHYLNALRRLVGDGEPPENEWNYLNLLITIGQAYQAVENYTMAKRFYLTVLRIVPDFAWVRDDLMPALQTEMNQ